MKKVNRKLVLLVLGGCLLSCGGTSPSTKPSNDSEEESIVYDYSDNLEERMINELSKGYAFESIHKLVETKSDSSTTYLMYLDAQANSNEYAYQKYYPIKYNGENSSSIARNKIYSQANYCEEDGYLAQRGLSVGNEVSSKKMLVKNSYVDWNASGYSNMFIDLTPSLFEKTDNAHEYKLNIANLDVNLENTIGHNILGEQTPSIESFIIRTDGYHITSYSVAFELVQPESSLRYEFDGQVVGRGKKDPKVSEHFLKPIDGKEDASLKNVNDLIKTNSYQETTYIYLMKAGGTEEYSAGMRIQRDKDVVKVFSDEVSFSYYYLDEDDLLYQARDLGDKGVYVNGYSYGKMKMSTPTFSSLILDAKGNGTFSYDKNDTKAISFDLSYFAMFYSAEIDTATISVNDNSVLIDAYCYIGNYTYHIYTTLDCLGKIDIPFEGSDVHNDGSDLQLSDLFYDFEYEDALHYALGGKDVMNNIPVLGGIFNNPYVDIGYDPGDDIMIQFYYDLCNVYDFDQNGDGSVSSSEYDIFLSYADDLLSSYYEKYDSSWSKNYTEYNSFEATYNQTFTRDGKTYILTVEAYVGIYSNYEAYFVIDACFKPIRYAVTFYDNYVGGSEKTLYISDGQAPNVADPIREGYAFMGWYEDSACTKKADMTKPITGVSNFYAKWEERDDVSVTFNYNYEGCPASVTVTTKYSGTISIVDDPIREGYTFLGWAEDKEGTTPKDIYGPIYETCTVYAAWYEGELPEDVA